MSYSSDYQCLITVTLYVLQQYMPVSYCSVPQGPKPVLASVLLQYLSMTNNNDFPCLIAVPLYVYSIVFSDLLQCPTAVFSCVLLLCLSMSYSIAFQCPITVFLKSYSSDCQCPIKVSLKVLEQCMPLTIMNEFFLSFLSSFPPPQKKNQYQDITPNYATTASLYIISLLYVISFDATKFQFLR